MAPSRSMWLIAGWPLACGGAPSDASVPVPDPQHYEGAWISASFVEKLRTTQKVNVAVAASAHSELRILRSSALPGGWEVLVDDGSQHEGYTYPLVVSDQPRTFGVAVRVYDPVTAVAGSSIEPLRVGDGGVVFKGHTFVRFGYAVPGATTFDDVVNLATIGGRYQGSDTKEYRFGLAGAAVIAGEERVYRVFVDIAGLGPIEETCDGAMSVWPQGTPPEAREYFGFVASAEEVQLFVAPALDGGALNDFRCTGAPDRVLVREE